MQYTINELYDHLLEKVNNVYEVFKGFFGESHVDFQTLSPEVAIKHRIMYKMSVLGINEVNLEKNNFDIPFEITDRDLEEIKDNLSDKKFFIYVWWSSVTVTNENDKSIDIQDLYARIEIQLDGRIPYENHGFLLNRATYTPEQLASNYMHSHINGIPTSNFAEFKEPCLGRGPIKNTIATLKNGYDEAEWMLFCQELSMYVTVESISGIPYHYLEKVGGNNKELYGYTGYDLSKADRSAFARLFQETELKKFIEYYLKNGHLSLTYKDSNFTFGMPYCDYIIDISNSFIDYYNKFLVNVHNRFDCFTYGLLNSATFKNNKFYNNNSSNNNLSFERYKGKKVLTFKGKEITINILDTDSQYCASNITVISNNFAMYVLRNILRTINFRYRNKYYDNRNTYASQAKGTAPSSACKRVIYI